MGPAHSISPVLCSQPSSLGLPPCSREGWGRQRSESPATHPSHARACLKLRRTRSHKLLPEVLLLCSSSQRHHCLASFRKRIKLDQIWVWFFLAGRGALGPASPMFGTSHPDSRQSFSQAGNRGKRSVQGHQVPAMSTAAFPPQSFTLPSLLRAPAAARCLAKAFSSRWKPPLPAARHHSRVSGRRPELCMSSSSRK